MKLPTEIIKIIVFYADLPVIAKLARLNTRFLTICQNEDLWKARFLASHSPRLTTPKSWLKLVQLHRNPVLEFYSSYTQPILMTPQLTGTGVVPIKCTIDCTRINPRFERGSCEPRSLIVQCLLLMQIVELGDAQTPLIISDENLNSDVVNVLSPYFNYAQQSVKDRRWYRHGGADGKFSIMTGSQFFIEVADLLNRD